MLPALLIPHPERAAAAALPQGCFHEGVGREGLACRYEQTVTTDGSGVTAALPRPRCSLPPCWRPRPINPKPCHLFSSLWIQKGSCEGCFMGFLAQAHTCHWTFPLCVLGDCRTAAVGAGSCLGDMWEKAVGYSCECLNCLSFQQHLPKPFLCAYATTSREETEWYEG